MKYLIDVKEINYGCIEVEANSKEEAYEKAEADYTLGRTVWDQGEYELSGIRPVKVRERGDAR